MGSTTNSPWVASMKTTMAVTSNVPVWLPGVSACVVFAVVGVLISLHPRFRNRYTPRPAAPGQPTLFQRRPRGPAVMTTDVVGLLHFKSAAAWLGVIPGVVVAIPMMIGLPLPIAVPAAAAPLSLAALAYVRPKRAVQGCEVDIYGAITLIRGDVRIPFAPSRYRYIRMHTTQSGASNYPSMMVLYRETRPTIWTWLGSVLFPRVDEERVVLFFNRWHTAEGYFVGPRDMAALFYQACVRAGSTPIETNGGWEVRPR